MNNIFAGVSARPELGSRIQQEVARAPEAIQMSRFKSKQQLIDEIISERARLNDLLSEIPDKVKETEEVIDGMTVKDFLAHRMQWGKMMTRWYQEAKAGKTPKVPDEKFKWNQLKQLNREIYKTYKDQSLGSIEKTFKDVHDELFKIVNGMSEKELLTKQFYPFTGSSTLATYVSGATAAHYRSARKHIQKWWKARSRAKSKL